MLIAKELKAVPSLVLWSVFRQVVSLFSRKVNRLIKNGYCGARTPSNEGVISENQVNLHFAKHMSPPVSQLASGNKSTLK